MDPLEMQHSQRAGPWGRASHQLEELGVPSCSLPGPRAVGGWGAESLTTQPIPSNTFLCFSTEGKTALSPWR